MLYSTASSGEALLQVWSGEEVGGLVDMTNQIKNVLFGCGANAYVLSYKIKKRFVSYFKLTSKTLVKSALELQNFGHSF